VAQKDLPGWGWWIEQGATTLWEDWRGNDSRFHVMYGDVDAWFYKALAGINPDPEAPGFKHFFIAPNVVGDLTWARASYNSVRGKIASDWKIANGQFHLTAKIPANTTATVTLPVSSAAQTTVNGMPLERSTKLRILPGKVGQTVVLLAPSGDYDFKGPLAGH
jgi:alpha-L-rhamnosidase